MRTLFCRAMALGVALCLAGCTSSEPPPTPSRVTKIRMLQQPYISFLPFFIAEEEGFFREQGIEVERVPVWRGVDGVPLLAQGEIDLYAGTVNVGIFNVIARGANIRLVADKGYAGGNGGAYTGFVVRKEMLESGLLADPGNWKGLKFDTNPNPDMKVFLLDRLLQSAGLAMEDVRHTHVNTPADCEALKTGAIDVSSTAEPWVARMVRGGYGAMWKTTEEIYPDFQVAFILYGSRLLTTDRDAGNRFMIAYLKAVRQYNQGKTERNLEIAVRHTDLDIETLKLAVWPPIREDGEIHAQSLLDFQDWAVESKAQEKRVEIRDFWDPGFIEHARKALPPPDRQQESHL